MIETVIVRYTLLKCGIILNQIELNKHKLWMFKPQSLNIRTEEQPHDTLNIENKKYH